MASAKKVTIYTVQGHECQRHTVFHFRPLCLVQVFDVNFFAGFVLSTAAIPHLEKTRGNIVFTSAGCEHENDNTVYLTRRIIVTKKCFKTLKTASKAYPTMASYCASKAAIDMLSKTIAVEEGPKVKGRHQGRNFLKKTFLHFYIFTSLATLSTSKPPSLSSFRGKLHKTYIITLM